LFEEAYLVLIVTTRTMAVDVTDEEFTRDAEIAASSFTSFFASVLVRNSL